LGRPIPLDPGPHEIVGQCGDQPPEPPLEIRLAEGTTERVQLEISCAAEQAAAPTESLEPTQDESSSKLLPTLGWTVVGIGGAGWVVSAVTWAVGRSEKASLEDDGICDADHTCEPGSGDDLKPYNSSRTISTVGFWAGGALLAAGTGTLLWHRSRTRERAASKAHVEAWVGPASAGVRGRF
jgi:hypothetical protein